MASRVVCSLLGAVAVAGAASPCSAADMLKTQLFNTEVNLPRVGSLMVKVLCGEDAAAAAGRAATNRMTGFKHAEIALKLAEQLEKEMQAQEPDYKPPAFLDTSTGKERLLKTAGAHSRRAAEAALNGDYKEFAADLLRGLMRPNLDSTARDRLLQILGDGLVKAEKKRRESKGNGDITELFEVLQIDDDIGTNADIDINKLKGVYRKLSVKYHPDKNPNADASHFNRIRDAYEILSDPAKALLYDTGGQELVQKYEGGSDELDRTSNIERKLTVTLEDVYKGASRQVDIHRRVVCRGCRLNPDLPRCKECRACPGTKEMRRKWIDNNRYYQEEVTIPSNEKCLRNSQQFDVAIEKGMASGDAVTYGAKASQEPKKIPGDLIFQIGISKHRIFRRVGADLVATLKVSLSEALLGFKRELVHLDGHIVKFGVDSGTVLKPGAGLEIAGEGMPLREDTTSFGRLLVKFEIEFPDSMPTDAQQLVKDGLAMASGGVPPSQTRVDYRLTGSRAHFKSEL